MRRTSFATTPCPIARSLDVVGDPWTLLVVREALFGVRRFDDFVDRLGIPRNTLTSRLATLVEAEVFERRAYQGSPVRYEYVLTPKGIALRSVIVSLLQWGDDWGEWGDDGVPVELRDAESGERLRFDHVDRTTGRRLEDLRVERVTTDRGA